MTRPARSQGDRSSFGHVTPAQIHFQSQQRFSLQQQQQSMSPNSGSNHQPHQQEEKRHSYANHSFRKALSQNQSPAAAETLMNGSGFGGGGVVADTSLEAELKNILRTQPSGPDRTKAGAPGASHINGNTPPLPALSPGPPALMMHVDRIRHPQNSTSNRRVRFFCLLYPPDLWLHRISI